MKILTLTWEFPPFISGGLGMACYGLIKALLEKGVEVDMILPTREEVFFPLRAPSDVDTLPTEFLDPRRRERIPAVLSGDVRSRLKALGLSDYPETYASPAVDFEQILEWVERASAEAGAYPSTEELRNHLRGEEDLFRRVQGYTARAMKYASFLEGDVIHVHDWLTYPAGLLLKRVLRRPLVAHIHATEFDRAGGPGDERIHKIEYAGLSAADLVIAVSQYTAQMVIDRYRIPAEKIRVVHNAYTLAEEALDRKRLFRDPTVLFLGRVTIQKGPDYFLEVARRVVERQPRVRFVMAGSGDMFSRILRGAAGAGLKDRFLFTGFLDREQVDQVLAATDILLLPSVSEPFGIVPLEAMARGAVAIVSKQSGVAEVITSAYKIDFWDVDQMTDTIVHLLEHPEERERMARAGQQEALAIGWQQAAEKVEGVYREALCST
jgi:glycogen(starch) synthase